MRKHLKYLLSLCLILFTFTSLYAQHKYAWAIPTGGGVTGGWGTSATDTAGNTYFLGNFGDPLSPNPVSFDADPGPGSTILTSNGSDDIYISKYNKNGELIWAKSFGGPGEDNSIYTLALDDNGNVYVAGAFEGLADYDPGPGVSMIGWNNAPTGGTFISKFTPIGDFQWVRTIRNGGLIRSIKADHNGNVYAYGEFWQTIDVDPGAGIVTLQPNLTSNGTASTTYIFKLDPNGIYVNSRLQGYGTANAPWENPEHMEFRGQFAYTVNYAHGATFITKYDEALNTIWIKSIDHCVANSVAVDDAGNVICVGAYDMNADFDPGPAVQPGTVPPNDNYQWLFVSKINSSGDFQWVRTMGSDSASTAFATWVTVDHTTGEIYLTGRLDKAIYFDGNNPTGYLESFPILEAFIEKLNPDGSFAWVLPLQTTGSSQGTFIHIDEHKNLYISGRSYLTTDYNPDPLEADTFSIYPPSDFLLKLSLPPRGSILNTSVCSSSLPYSWNGNNYYVGGTYSVLLTGVDGVDSIPILNLAINETPDVNLGMDTTICIGKTLRLDVTSPNATYQWQDGSVNSSYNISKDGIYWVKLNLNGCENSDTLIVDSKDCNCITSIPNAITPNGDGINDRWIISDCAARFIVSVYNRYGSLVYYSENYHNDWMGTYGSKNCPDGTYYYVLKLVSPDLKEKVLRGNVTILR